VVPSGRTAIKRNQPGQPRALNPGTDMDWPYQPRLPRHGSTSFSDLAEGSSTTRDGTDPKPYQPRPRNSGTGMNLKSYQPRPKRDSTSFSDLPAGSATTGDDLPKKRHCVSLACMPCRNRRSKVSHGSTSVIL
jgi:hypothetical protein